MSWVRRLLGWAEHAAAVGFLAVVAAGLVLAVAGVLDRRTADDVLGVVSGRRTAVANRDYQRWQELDQEAQSRSLVESEERMISGQAVKAAWQESQRRDRQFEMELAMLRTLAEQVDRRETGLAQRAGEFEARSREREAQLAKAEQQARDQHFRRSLQVYQGMDPELVAADLQKKWGGGPEEKREVVSVLRSLPSRVSAEVMNAIADSTTRVEIMKEVKGS